MLQCKLKYNPLPSMDIPPSTPKYAYGKVKMLFALNIPLLVSSMVAYTSVYPVTMEQLDHYYGFIVYQHKLKQPVVNKVLDLSGVRDRAYVSIGSKTNPNPVGMVQRGSKSYDLTISANQYDIIHIFIENQGRINYGNEMNDNHKGLVSNVTLDGEILSDWQQYPLNLEKTDSLLADTPGSLLTDTPDKLLADTPDRLPTSSAATPAAATSAAACVPSLYAGTLTISEEPMDTYLDVSMWTKGQLYVNHENLGRYWPNEGPQVRLYIPKFALRRGDNQVVLLELESCPLADDSYVEFMDQPLINGTVPGGATEEKISLFMSIVNLAFMLIKKFFTFAAFW